MGPADAKSFIKPRRRCPFLLKVIANVQRSKGLSFAKVRTMLKLFG